MSSTPSGTVLPSKRKRSEGQTAVEAREVITVSDDDDVVVQSSSPPKAASGHKVRTSANVKADIKAAKALVEKLTQNVQRAVAECDAAKIRLFRLEKEDAEMGNVKCDVCKSVLATVTRCSECSCVMCDACTTSCEECQEEYCTKCADELPNCYECGEKGQLTCCDLIPSIHRGRDMGMDMCRECLSN